MDHQDFWLNRPLKPIVQQNLNIVDMNNPIKVELTANSKKVGYGLAIHPHFIVARPGVLRPGLMVSSYEDGKRKHHEVLDTEPMAGGWLHRKCNFVLLQTTELILLHNAYTEHGSFSQQGYKVQEIKCIREYVENYITQCHHSLSTGPSGKASR